MTLDSDTASTEISLRNRLRKGGGGGGGLNSHKHTFAHNSFQRDLTGRTEFWIFFCLKKKYKLCRTNSGGSRKKECFWHCLYLLRGADGQLTDEKIH
jgi:hypothetical protein